MSWFWLAEACCMNEWEVVPALQGSISTCSLAWPTHWDWGYMDDSRQQADRAADLKIQFQMVHAPEQRVN